MFAYEECQSDILLVVNSGAMSTFFPGGCEDFVNNAVTTLTTGAAATSEIGIINAASGPGAVGSGKTGANFINSDGTANTAVAFFVDEHDALATLNAAAGGGFGQTGASVQITNAASAITARDEFIADHNAALELAIIDANQGQGINQNGASVPINSIANANQAHTDFVNNNNVLFRLNEVQGTAIGQSGAAAVTDGPSAVTARTIFVNNHDAVTELNAAAGTAAGQTGAATISDDTSAITARNVFIADHNLALAVNLLNNANPSDVAGLKITDPSILTVPTYPTSVPALTTGQTDAAVKAAANPGTAFSTDVLHALLVVDYVQLACQPALIYGGNPTTDALTNLCHVLCGAGAAFGTNWPDCATA